MTLTLLKSVTAMAPGRSTYVVGTGGTEPYVYTILPDGAGGSLSSSSGEALYTAPAVAPSDPSLSYVTIQVEDDLGATATGQILITDPLGLFCEIIQQEMELDNGRVYLWDQKIFQPSDSGLYVAVSVLNTKPFGNTLTAAASGGGVDAVQSINMLATLGIDIISRSTEALRRKEEVLMALASTYSQNQQTANSFNIGRLPAGGQFVNLSMIDGAAIPYRFNISINMQYFATNTKAVEYFDDFEDPEIDTDPETIEP